jgi:putative aminopeptidase FrvX
MKKNKPQMKKEEFLEKYLNTQSPTGWEMAGQEVWIDYIQDYVDKVQTDAYGNAVGVKYTGQSSKYKVVIEAHADEIGWNISHIDEKGYISVVRNGGSDEMVAPGQRVNILGKKGNVRGVFGWIAIHERDKETPEVKNLYVDVGASSKKEVEKMGIHVGATMTYDAPFEKMGDYYLCRALDNRIGGYMVANVARKLEENDIELPFDLYIVNAVQEEVGLHGAEMIANSIQPDVAIITDVTHDSHSPMYNARLCGDVSCGNGPTLYYGPDIQRNLLDQVLGVAKKNKIKYQLGTYNGNSGTDTSAFFKSSGGIPSCLISLPLKYMHTSVEMVMKKDVKNTTNLIYHSLLEMSPKDDYRYIKRERIGVKGEAAYHV